MTDRVTRIYEGALQLLIHRNGAVAVSFKNPSIHEEMARCAALAVALNKVVETTTKETSDAHRE